MTKIVNRPVVLVLEGLSGAVDCVRLAGGDTLRVSPRDRKAVEAAFDEGVVDALLLTGGGDVDPRRYGQRPHRETYGVSEARDRVEFRAVELANQAGVPILGICRGSQVLNVQAGGTLVQHLEDRLVTDVHHRTEPVHLLPGSRAQAAVGRRSARVIHIHHQAARHVAPGWRAVAWHTDGTIEAIERLEGPWAVGVQFHPEMASASAPEAGLFRALVVHAAKLARLPVPRPRARLAAPSIIRRRKEPVPGVRARVRELPPVGPVAPVDVSWRCFRCLVNFDERLDFVDHMAVLHGVTVGDGTRLPTGTNRRS